MEAINNRHTDIVLGYAAISSTMVRVISWVLNPEVVYNQRFFLTTSLVAFILTLYLTRKKLPYKLKLYAILGILILLFTNGLYNKSLLTNMLSLLVTAPMVMSYMANQRLAVTMNLIMLGIFLMIGSVIIFRTGLNLDAARFILNTWNGVNDALVMGFSTLAIMIIGRSYHQELTSIHRSLEMKQEQLERKAAELRRSKDELETEVLARTEELRRTNEVIHESNILIAEKNLEIAWQNEETEKTISEIKKIELDLVESDKLASIGLFAKGISENITSPMNDIRREEQLIRTMISQEKPAVREKLSELSIIITNGLERIDRIITDLGRVSNTQDGEQTDLHTIAQVAMRATSALTGSSVRVRVEDPGFPVLVRGNAARLERVFINLITNAIHALEDNPHGRIAIRFSTDGMSMTARVEDNGRGIDPEHLAKVKEPFFTTKDPGKGTGLGLFLCQSLMEEAGGRLEIESQPGQGTSILLIFPNNDQPLRQG